MSEVKAEVRQKTSMNKTSINQLKDKAMPTKKAIIKTTDMPDEMQEDAVYFASLGTVGQNSTKMYYREREASQ